ncbi:MAG: DUF6502 family protein [Pseudomonadota bacterium]
MAIESAGQHGRKSKRHRLAGHKQAPTQRLAGSALDKESSLLTRSLLSIFRPIARGAIDSSVDVRHLIEILKVAYIDVATDEYGIRGRPTTTSRIAIMSGLTRKEIGATKTSIEAGEALSTVSRTVCQRVLDSWWSEDDFLNSAGNPIDLPYEDGSPTFVDLCHIVGGDFPAGAARTELLRAGSIELLDRKGLRPLRRIHATDKHYADFSAALSDFIAAAMIREKLDDDVEELAAGAAIVRAIRDK